MLKLFTLASIAFGACAPAAVEAASTCGRASFYGALYHGRIAASGEQFDRHAMTAAHRSLPFGTRVQVVNQDNGRSVLLKINDRGPTYGSRIIDLSESAFAQIASLNQGLARVCYNIA